jgi:hypothetical protein
VFVIVFWLEMRFTGKLQRCTPQPGPCEQTIHDNESSSPSPLNTSASNFYMHVRCVRASVVHLILRFSCPMMIIMAPTAFPLAFFSQRIT